MFVCFSGANIKIFLTNFLKKTLKTFKTSLI